MKSAVPLPISCYIIAYNEADRIANAINSVKHWVSEVIVIDSGSTDDTVAVAKELGARAIYNPWPGYGLQKRFGEDACKHTWLLNLDADEEITPQLAQEIQTLFVHGEPIYAGYFLKVRDLLPGEKKLAWGAHTNHCLRLYNKNYGRFSDSPVHDSVILNAGTTAILQAPVLHRSFRSFAHAIEKINSYSTVQAKELQRKPLSLPWARLIIEFPVAFIKAYLLRGYIFRGWRGFSMSVIYAFGRFVRVAKYIELKQRSN